MPRSAWKKHSISKISLSNILLFLKITKKILQEINIKHNCRVYLYFILVAPEDVPRRGTKRRAVFFFLFKLICDRFIY